jgi:hypothetical protein
MHIEIDRVLVRITETTLRELMKEIDQAKALWPSKKTVLLKSDYHTMRFLIDMDVGDRGQKYNFYKVISSERSGK